jgi:hypothetical protein
MRTAVTARRTRRLAANRVSRANGPRPSCPEKRRLAVRKPRAGPARPFVFRLSREDELQCRAWARTEGKSLSVFLRDLLTAYCQQLRKRRKEEEAA